MSLLRMSRQEVGDFSPKGMEEPKGGVTMHAYPYAAATLAFISQWAVGIAATSAIADTESGLIRDHPSYGRKLCTAVVPPLIMAGLAAPFVIDGHFMVRFPPEWILYSILMLLPFAGISYRWSRTWLHRTPACKRRRLGLAAGISGGAAIALSSHLAITGLNPPWIPTFPMMLFLSNAAMLGSLTTVALLALTARLPSEVPSGPARHVIEVGGFGFLAAALAAIDIGRLILTGEAGVPAQALILSRIWVAGALLIPGLLLLSRQLRRRLPDSVLMTSALGIAAAGQYAGLILIFRYPGLVPPAFTGL